MGLVSDNISKLKRNIKIFFGKKKKKITESHDNHCCICISTWKCPTFPLTILHTEMLEPRRTKDLPIVLHKWLGLAAQSIFQSYFLSLEKTSWHWSALLSTSFKTVHSASWFTLNLFKRTTMRHFIRPRLKSLRKCTSTLTTPNCKNGRAFFSLHFKHKLIRWVAQWFSSF